MVRKKRARLLGHGSGYQRAHTMSIVVRPDMHGKFQETYGNCARDLHVTSEFRVH